MVFEIDVRFAVEVEFVVEVEVEVAIFFLFLPKSFITKR